ncbi:MAG: integrase core domain-containing protein [Acidimicrobiales bacterium]
MTAIRLPPRSPHANPFAERWVRTVRHELLDRTIIWDEHQLRRLLNEYIERYNTHRLRAHTAPANPRPNQNRTSVASGRFFGMRRHRSSRVSPTRGAGRPAIRTLPFGRGARPDRARRRWRRCRW